MNTKYMTLEDATEALLTYAPAIRPKSYDLSVMKEVMRILGNPEQSLRIIHVAGTSGKTSTCYYIRGLLEAAGKKTGLTVSPHITGINERVQISGYPLESDKFLLYFNEFIEIINSSGITPSYYELTMSLAYFVFAKESVDYAVIETGLGGLLDGSNVANKKDKICVIQRIGYDHTEVLGETLPEIALQKAGIIHESNIVFVLEQQAEALDTITDYANTKHAEIHVVSDTHVNDMPVAYQQANWSMAFAVYEYLVHTDGLEKLSNETIDELKNRTPPGRYEIYNVEAKKVILDGAHNGQKLTALMDSMADKGIHNPLVVVSLKDADEKKLDECMAAIAVKCDELIITTFRVGQDARFIVNADVNRLRSLANKYRINTRIIPDQREAYESALNGENNTILITGSLYLVSDMRRFIAD